eukprot:gene14822-19613_t
MKTRRAFLKLTATGALAVTAARAQDVPASSASLTTTPGTPPRSLPSPTAPISTGTLDRATWVRLAQKLASPLLPTLAARRLKATMPIESAPRTKDRPDYTHLEGIGRLLCGLAPWLELAPDATPEGAERARLAALVRTAIDAATDPQSPDFLNFSKGRQPLVDAAFL